MVTVIDPALPVAVDDGGDRVGSAGVTCLHLP